MSVVQNPIIGRASGKFSTAIFQKWKNKNVLRSKPLTVANPDTVGQQQRRKMFAQAVFYGRAISPILIIGFSGFKAVLTWMNVFLKRNLDQSIIAGVAPAFSVDLTKMVISEGPMTPTPPLSCSGVNASQNVAVTWDSTIIAPDQAATDIACIVVFNETSEAVGYLIGSAINQRSTGAAVVVTNFAATSADVLYAYLFFMRLDGSIVSSNDYYSDIVP